VPEGKPSVVKPQLHRETPARWAGYLSHANSWWRETAQRLLVERNDASVAPALVELATKGASPLGRLHALWTLEGMNRLDDATVLTALDDTDPRVRAAAIRVSEPLLKSDKRGAVLPKLISSAAKETEPFVQQQLALTLGEAADKDADFAMATLVKRAPDNLFIQDAALSGLFGRELELLERLLSDADWRGPDANTEKFLGALARCTFSARRAERTEQLLSLVAARPRDKRIAALLDGIFSVTTKKPAKFKAEPVALAQLSRLTDKSIRPRVEKLTALLTWPDKPGAEPEPVVVPLTPEQQARFDMGKMLYSGVCAACHQPHGLGVEGLAPPLADSEWVLGSEQRLARILLHGLTGEIRVKGRPYRLDMPALGLFTDDQIASVLTYVRREWDHTANPVEPETIKSIRAATSGRTEGWRQEELLSLP
jgi:mono/diheme cytochrome c family protein